MKKIKALLIGTFFLIPTITLAAIPELGKYPEIYKGSNYLVTLLRLGDKANDTVLIKVDGIDNKFDGQIYLHTKKCMNTRCTAYKYETKEIPDKKQWGTIQATLSWGNNYNLIMYPPGVNTKSYIYNTKRPTKFDAEKFYNEYQGQKIARNKSN